jgi:endoglucanase
MKKSIMKMTGLVAVAAVFCILYMTCNDSGAGSGKPDDRANEFVKKFNRPSESGSGNDSGHTVTPQHVHDWSEWKVTTEATCDAMGLKTRICTIDNSHTETEVIPMTTGEACAPTDHVHDWGDWEITTNATCDATGLKTRFCTIDNSHTEIEVIPKQTGVACNTTHTHVWSDWVVTTQATCDATGLKTRTCTIDNSHTETEVIPMTTGAACNTTHTHVWGDWTITTQATCDATGLKTRICTIDNSHTESEVIAKQTGTSCTPTPPDGGGTVKKYAVKVTGGSASADSFVVGDRVTVTAGNPPTDYYVFKNWTATSNDVSFDNPTNLQTTFIMPEHDVTVTANFVEDEVIASQTPVKQHGWLAVNGNRLVDQSGKPVQLRGMSFFWSILSEGYVYYNANAVKWLANDWKVSVVRAAMGVNEDWGKGYLNGGKDVNKQRVVTVADAAIAKGIYVIIDWHSHNAHTHTDSAKVFFEEMARKYKDVPNVLYEIYNEPTGGNADAWTNDIKPYAQTVVNAIRAIDPNNVIIIGTPMWCLNPNIATANPVDGENLVYSMHFLSASHSSESYRANVRASLNTHNKAVFVSEFGVCKSDGGGPPSLTETTKWLDFLDSNEVSWVNWSVTYNNECGSALKSSVRKFDGNWTTDDLTESGTYIRNRLRATPVLQKRRQ